MSDPRRKNLTPLRLEQLETREAPSVVPLSQSFDTTPAGALPSGWQQWSSGPQATFAASAARSLTPSQSLVSNVNVGSQITSRAWYNAIQPPDVEVSAAVYADNASPVQLIARGNNLGGANANYYAAQVFKGLDLRIVRVQNGVSYALASINWTSPSVSSGWVRVTFQLVGTSLRAQAYRMDTGQFLDSTGRWQAARVWALTVTDTAFAAGGYVGFGRPNSAAGSVYFDDFRLLGPEGDTQNPSVNITSPGAANWLTGAQTVRVQASDNVGVAKVELYLDGALRSVDRTAPFEWTFDTATVSNGAHTLTARAFDISGNTSSTSLPILTWSPDSLWTPSIPRHYPHIRVAQLAYGQDQFGPFEQQLLRNSVDLVVTQGGGMTGQIGSVAPSTPQMLYTNISTVYQSLLTDWLYADANGYRREGAFYHATQPTAYSGTSPSSQPVNWFWSVYRDGTSWRNYTVNSRGTDGLYTYFGDKGESIYVAFPEKFRQLNLSVILPASNGWWADFEYASAVDAAGKPTQWKFLSKTGDDTQGFKQSGWITWKPPADWKPASVNGSAKMYYVRFRTTSAGTAPIVRSVLGRDYTNASGGNTGVIPVFDSAADLDGDGFLNDTEWSRRATGKDARFLYESRALYGSYGQMRFTTNPADTGFRAWVADYLERFLSNQPATVGLFMDNSQANAPVAAGAVRENVSTYSHDFATLIHNVAESIQPRWLLANTTSDEVIQQNTAYYDEFSLKPLAHNYAQFETLAGHLQARMMLRTPPPYVVLDSHPQGGSPTDPRTQLATLAYYYLLQDPVRTFINFFGGYEPTTTWTRHWVPAAAYNIGGPTELWREFATGKDPEDPSKSYRVYQRAYQNALVLYKPVSYGGGPSGTISNATATTHTLPGTFRPLNADGTLGAPVTNVTLRNGEGAILIRV